MDYFKVGDIVNTHGIKGEVRVVSITDYPEERFAPGKKLYIYHDSEPKARAEVVVASHRNHKSFHLLTFEGIQSINEVETYKGMSLHVPETDLHELAEDEYYFHDLIGLDVQTEDGQKIGQIKEIMETGSNDVWVVKRPKKTDLLLPAIPSVILEVDLEGASVTVHILEGLDDDEN